MHAVRDLPQKISKQLPQISASPYPTFEVISKENMKESLIHLKQNVESCTYV
jgi:hypothetical protein